MAPPSYLTRVRSAPLTNGVTPKYRSIRYFLSEGLHVRHSRLVPLYPSLHRHLPVVKFSPLGGIIGW